MIPLCPASPSSANCRVSPLPGNMFEIRCRPSAALQRMPPEKRPAFPMFFGNRNCFSSDRLPWLSLCREWSFLFLALQCSLPVFPAFALTPVLILQQGKQAVFKSPVSKCVQYSGCCQSSNSGIRFSHFFTETYLPAYRLLQRCQIFLKERNS